VSRKLAARYWAGHLLALILMGTAGLLGAWQLDAWQTRRDDEARDLTHVAPVAVGDLLGPDDPFPADALGRPAELQGTWLPTGTVFISGREQRGQDGYWMVTPLAIGSADDPALPVVLGWLADPAAAPPAPEGPGDLVGLLQPSEAKVGADADPGDDVLPQLRTADLVQRVDQDLYGAYAIARAGVSGLPAADPRALPEPGRFTALRNLLYAIEWWFFGGFAAFVWWRWLVEEPFEEPGAQDDLDDVATVDS
jgi:cytochrome oxidase assembly protein ShyY1